ncbi:unnamed protein product [Mytilus edulis]|uniref:Integrase zinc-binding domain-containing protein n=1 Tax=Mytilus edulis TaxID=6550 RepID=A0A8S3SP41_MYTED|nr:unnamed protein product [Mytilus edulis]
MWSLGIYGYNCKIEYIAGETNYCADLLSRTPQSDYDKGISNETVDPDINDNTYEINTINSNKLNTRNFATCTVEQLDLPSKKTFQNEDLDMKLEQAKDLNIVKVKKEIETGTASSSTQSQFMIIEDVVYFLSQPDIDPLIRLYVPEHLREYIVVQYHDNNGHLGIDKTYDSIKLRYYWPGLYKQIYAYVTMCVTCQTRNLRKVNPPVQEVDIPPYPFAKIALDLSGPYPETLSGTKYIIGFIDLYSGFPEAFAVKDKKKKKPKQLLICLSRK